MTENVTDAPVTGGSDELSPELKDYFSSKGAKPMPGGEPKAGADKPEPDATADAPAGETAQAEPDAPDIDEAPSSDGEQPQNEQQKKDRKVSYNAYMREQAQRKEAEQRVGKMQEDFARAMEAQQKRDAILNERLARMMAPQPDPNAPPPVDPNIPPDPEEDFIAYAKWQRDLEIQRRNMTTEQRAREQQAAQTRQFQEQVVTTWNNIAAQRVQNDPEFVDAYRYAIRQRFAELKASGLTDDQAAGQAQRDEFDFVASSLQQRVDPTERMKAIASARGWKYTPPQPDQQQPDPKRLDTIAKAQDANKTLTGTGSSGSARGTITASDIAKMSGDEFETWFDKVGPKGYKAAMTR